MAEKIRYLDQEFDAISEIDQNERMYLTRISELERENAELRKELQKLQERRS